MPFSSEHQALLRIQLWDILQSGKGEWGRVFMVGLIGLILLSIAILPLEFIPMFEHFEKIFLAIEIIITILFTVEYILRIYAAPSRLHYIFSFYGLIDFVAIAPFFVGFFHTEALKLLRLTRLLRILKISHIQAATIQNEATTIEGNIGLFTDEHILYVVSRHPLFLMFGLVPPLISISTALFILLAFPGNSVTISIVLTLGIFTLIFLYKAWLDYRHDVIYVTTHRLIFQNWHLLGRNTNQVNFRAIMNVKPEYTGIWSYLLGFGSIVIETAAETASIRQSLVRSHEKAANIIMERVVKAKEGSL